MKRVAVVLAVALTCASGPAFAGSASVYGSYWDAGDSHSVEGIGARIGFELVSRLELEFHATLYEDLVEDTPIGGIEVTAYPIDGGLRINLLPEKKCNLYVGGGFSYYLMDSDFGKVDDDSGYYGEVGIEIGTDKTTFVVEIMWRDLSATLENPGGAVDVDFSGLAGNIGAGWRW